MGVHAHAKLPCIHAHLGGLRECYHSHVPSAISNQVTESLVATERREQAAASRSEQSTQASATSVPNWLSGVNTTSDVAI